MINFRKKKYDESGCNIHTQDDQFVMNTNMLVFIVRAVHTSVLRMGRVGVGWGREWLGKGRTLISVQSLLLRFHLEFLNPMNFSYKFLNPDVYLAGSQISKVIVKRSRLNERKSERLNV